MLESKNNYRPRFFFICTFIITWSCWFLAQGVKSKYDADQLYICFMLIGLCAPFFSALWLIFSAKNKMLRSVFFNKLFNLRMIKWRSIPAIILIPPISMMLAILISICFGFSWNQFIISESFSFHIGSLPTLLTLFLAASLEELGWRGYAIESLECSLKNYFNATAAFSVLWALWHLPLFLVTNTYQNIILQQNIIYAINFMVGIIPLAFIISWICKMNRGSIASAIFLHFMINISQELFNVNPWTKCIQTGVLSLAACYVVFKNKEMFYNAH